MPTLTRPPAADPRITRSMRAFGTTAAITLAGAAGGRLDRAAAILAEEIAAMDAACSRFRPDSEIMALGRSAGRPVPVSDLLFEAVVVACDVAILTCGTVDPTVGGALSAAGYDRDFESIPDDAPEPATATGPVPGWWVIGLDEHKQTITVPEGVTLDLGATAKALAADRVAASVAAELGRGCLVNIGGDVAVAGDPPAGGWPIGIALDSAATPDQVDVVVAIAHGGLASSGTVTRSWRRGGRTMHHIIDPITGEPAAEYWQLVSATGASCVEANALSAAGLIWGEDAVGNLAAMSVPARLVGPDGTVELTGGWPADEPYPAQESAVA